VRQAGPRGKAALGTRRRRMAIIHRTVRWCTGLSGESSAVNSSPSGKVKGRHGYNSPDCPVSQRSPTPTVGRAIFARRVAAPTVGGGTRLSGAPTGPELQRSSVLRMERNQASDMNSSCPVVHHMTEGKIGLLRLSPTAPSCLGAIKGTPRRMEDIHKLTRNILRLPDSDSTHLILCVSYLSSI
jgi:hypothetical protein